MKSILKWVGGEHGFFPFNGMIKINYYLKEIFKCGLA